MASSTQCISFLFTLFLILFSTPSSATDIPPLIPEACSKSGADTQLCIKVLESEDHVSASIDFYDLCANIIDAGISNATSVHVHIRHLLKHKKKEANMIKALKSCESGYKSILLYFKGAVRELRGKQGRLINDQYQSASYDLFKSGDGIRMCEDAVSSSKIEDKIIVKGNKFAEIFRRSAIHVVDDIISLLQKKSAEAAAKHNRRTNEHSI